MFIYVKPLCLINSETHIWRCEVILLLVSVGKGAAWKQVPSPLPVKEEYWH